MVGDARRGWKLVKDALHGIIHYSLNGWGRPSGMETVSGMVFRMLFTESKWLGTPVGDGNDDTTLGCRRIWQSKWLGTPVGDGNAKATWTSDINLSSLNGCGRPSGMETT